MRYQMEFRLATVLQEVGTTPKALASELGINPAHVARLCEDNWSTIQRVDLQKLLSWARKHQQDLLKVEPNPLWRTLCGSEVLLFRGRNRDGNPLHSDSNVERELIVALEEEACRITPHSLENPTEAQIVESMQTKNCVFIGSPKFNAATEVALAALWGLRPRETAAANRKLSPVQFVWDASYDGKSAFGTSRHDGEPMGINVGSKTSLGVVSKRFLVPVDWKSARQYAQWTGRGRDAGIMVVCYRPLNTRAEVTTIVLAGHSGFATVDMATDFVRDELRFEAHELRPSVVTMKVLSASYKKRAGRGDSRSRFAKGRRWFTLPWNQLESLTKRAKIGTT